ncbi:MAG: hypothetical protein JWO06_1424 [Bacteroidota bacterium]|nr:hypothetical protein [Bacteroidota bacterium]
MADEFSEILKKIKALIKVYEPKLAVKKDSDKGYELYTAKEAVVAGRTYPAIFFAAAQVQKNFIGFYYFPIYCRPELKEKLHPDLMKKLKGKSCFHIKKDDKETYQQIKDALKIGFDEYKKQGWV